MVVVIVDANAHFLLADITLVIVVVICTLADGFTADVALMVVVIVGANAHFLLADITLVIVVIICTLADGRAADTVMAGCGIGSIMRHAGNVLGMTCVSLTDIVLGMGLTIVGVAVGRGGIAVAQCFTLSCITDGASLGGLAISIYPAMRGFLCSSIGIVAVDRNCILSAGSITLVDDFTNKPGSQIGILASEGLSPDNRFTDLGAIQQVSNLAGSKLCFRLEGGAIQSICLCISQVVAVCRFLTLQNIAANAAIVVTGAGYRAGIVAVHNLTGLLTTQNAAGEAGSIGNIASVVAIFDLTCRAAAEGTNYAASRLA